LCPLLVAQLEKGQCGCPSGRLLVKLLVTMFSLHEICLRELLVWKLLDVIMFSYTPLLSWRFSTPLIRLRFLSSSLALLCVKVCMCARCLPSITLLSHIIRGHCSQGTWKERGNDFLVSAWWWSCPAMVMCELLCIAPCLLYIVWKDFAHKNKLWIYKFFYQNPSIVYI
jgi:hypothetical protein